eukprot:m.65153 g.65153  ORF g.65153 m.65153 type:complete len:55 (+) comp8143_c0_seq4:615-779(+)
MAWLQLRTCTFIMGVFVLEIVWLVRAHQLSWLEIGVIEAKCALFGVRQSPFQME